MQDGAAVLAFAFARRAAAVRGVRRFAARIARFLTSAGNTYMQIYLVHTSQTFNDASYNKGVYQYTRLPVRAVVIINVYIGSRGCPAKQPRNVDTRLKMFSFVLLVSLYSLPLQR